MSDGSVVGGGSMVVDKNSYGTEAPRTEQITLQPEVRDSLFTSFEAGRDESSMVSGVLRGSFSFVATVLKTKMYVGAMLCAIRMRFSLASKVPQVVTLHMGRILRFPGARFGKPAGFTQRRAPARRRMKFALQADRHHLAPTTRNSYLGSRREQYHLVKGPGARAAGGGARVGMGVKMMVIVTGPSGSTRSSRHLRVAQKFGLGCRR